MKKRMSMAISRHGLSLFYKCYNGVLYYGKKCPDRDDGHKCMTCKFCKCEMSAFDATKMLESYGKKFEEGRKQ